MTSRSPFATIPKESFLRALKPFILEPIHPMSQTSYKDAGVDLELYQQAMNRLPALMQRTRSSRVSSAKAL